MSRHWRKVSKATQKLAAGLLEIKSEGMFPYETYYVLATDTELERLYEWKQQAFARLPELRASAD
jgi:chromatin segregation and condensation protein Rec8/ScpA/Scc1 (kleisin family)